MSNLNRYHLLRNHFTHVGFACNCNPVYGEICVFELGKHVEEIVPAEFNHFFLRPQDAVFRDFSKIGETECVPDMPDYYQCVWWWSDFWYEKRRLDTSDLPYFKLANDPTCSVGSREGYCSEIDYEASVDSPPALLGITDWYNDFESFYTSLNSSLFTFAQLYDYYDDPTLYPGLLAESLDFKLFTHINSLRTDPTSFYTAHKKDFAYDFASTLEFDQF